VREEKPLVKEEKSCNVREQSGGYLYPAPSGSGADPGCRWPPVFSTVQATARRACPMTSSRCD